MEAVAAAHKEWRQILCAAVPTPDGSRQGIAVLLDKGPGAAPSLTLVLPAQALLQPAEVPEAPDNLCVAAVPGRRGAGDDLVAHVRLERAQRRGQPAAGNGKMAMGSVDGEQAAGTGCNHGMARRASCAACPQSLLRSPLRPLPAEPGLPPEFQIRSGQGPAVQSGGERCAQSAGLG